MSKYKKNIENNEIILSEEEISNLFESYDSLIVNKKDNEMIDYKHVNLYLCYLDIKSNKINKNNYIIIKKK